MGTMVGDDGGTNQIGVAPQAKWIACRGCALGSSCADSHLTACAEWVLNPDQNINTADQADVVNNSWGGGGGDGWYRSFVQNWRAAGVFPAFSIGNAGPNCYTAGSPGDYPESFASGATNSLDGIASFSSRGPSLFGGIKPNLSAPGVSVRSSVPTDGYASYNGTSMASPHTAGTVALVWAAAPGYRTNISGTEAILRGSALPLTSATQTCGEVPGTTVPNNTYGWGRLDALKAVQDAGGPVNQPPTVTIDSPANGSSYACPVTVNFTGTASDPEDGDVTGSIVWSEGAEPFGTGGTASKPFTCTQTGNHNITAQVTDSKGASDTYTITISITNGSIPAAPSNLTASVSALGVVALTWQDNSNNELGFKVERKAKGGSWGQIGTTDANVTTFQNSPGKGNWQYRVYAYNASGNSAYSNPVSARVR